MSSSILGQQTALLASCFILCIPICPRCRCSRTCLRMFVGMTTRDPNKRHRLQIDSESLCCLRRCISVPSFEFASGHPSLVNRSTLESNESLADSCEGEE